MPNIFRDSITSEEIQAATGWSEAEIEAAAIENNYCQIVADGEPTRWIKQPVLFSRGESVAIIEAAQAESSDLLTLLRAITPEIKTPIYVALESQGAPFSQLGGEWVGLAGRDTDLVVRNYLESRGEWQGRGFGVLIRDLQLGDDATLNVLNGIALHELGHCLVAGLPTPDATPEHQATAVLLASNTGTTSQKITDYELPPFAGHGAKWIRCVLHLLTRAELLGADVSTTWALPLLSYELSVAEKYQSALLPELQQTRDLDILNLPATPPAEFVQLWQADVKRWTSKNQQRMSGDCLDAVLTLHTLFPTERN